MAAIVVQILIQTLMSFRLIIVHCVVAVV